MDDNLKKTLEDLTPEIEPRAREDFVARMDPDYFSLCPAEEIAAHLRMACSLTPGQAVLTKIDQRGEMLFDIAIVAYDYFAEFSVICGLLAAFGMDIQSGHIYTYAEKKAERIKAPFRRTRRAIGSRKKIVDLFTVRLLPGDVFDRSRQKEFAEELRSLLLLLDQNQIQEARGRINRRVVEYLSRSKGMFLGRMYPVEVSFDNTTSEKWTVMEIRAKDTPAFLYAFSNALSMQGLYIHKVIIENIGGEAHDRIYLSDREGRKIEGEKEQEFLRLATVMVKQFTHFLGSAPDPAMALQHFDLLLDKLMERELPESVRSFLGQRETLDFLARLLGASDFLWEDYLRMQFENLLPILQDFKKAEPLRNKERMRGELDREIARHKDLGEKKEVLNRYKDREMFRIDMNHLLAPPADMMIFSGALSDLAELVLEEAFEVCCARLAERHGRPALPDGSPCPYAVCGLGKFGGREMGYASDIEILFLYKGSGRTRGAEPLESGDFYERLCESVLDFIEAKAEGIFHIDMRLRPHGRAGPLANPINRIMEYYSPFGEAAPFERQALTKLRWVAGDESLGRSMETHRDNYVYGSQPWDLKTALHLRKRQIKELVKPGLVNVKYSPGGVIDIEYAAQYLQIMHGSRHPEVRSTSTLDALEGLYRVGLISRGERDKLRGAYLFLRTLIDGLRIVRGNAKDLILPDPSSAEFKFLARRLGYAGKDWEAAAHRLAQDIETTMGEAHRFFVDRFGDA